MHAIDLQELQWKAYFGWLSALADDKVEVQSASLENTSGEWVTLRGANYDGENDILDLDFGSFHHVIDCPTRIQATAEDDGLLTISVLDSDGIASVYRCRLKPTTNHRRHASTEAMAHRPQARRPNRRDALRRK